MDQTIPKDDANTILPTTIPNLISDIIGEIPYVEDYVYHSKYMKGDALDLFTDFINHNQYIIKGSTGAGGTTAMLNQTKRNCIILTPNRSQVIDKQSKKETFKCKQPFFIYGNSQGKSNNWDQVMLAMQSNNSGIVTMTVFDSFFYLKDDKPEIYEYFKDCDILIDECHTIFKDDFRSIMKTIYEEIKTWRGTIKFSTATPQPYYLDMPISMNISLNKVYSSIKRNQRVFYSEDPKDYRNFIETELNYNRKVLCFTNDASKFNELITTYGGDGGDAITNIVHTSTGKSLRYSVNRFEEESEKYKIKSSDIISHMIDVDDEDLKSLQSAMKQSHKQLFICSSAYFAGWDFEDDCSICLISTQMNKNYNLDWIDIIQAFGRARNNISNILYINAPSANADNLDKTCKQRVGGDWIEYAPTITLELLQQRFNNIPNDDTYENIGKKLFLLNEFITLNPIARINKFGEYGYHIEPYIKDTIDKDFSKSKFTDYILNLMTFKLTDITTFINTIGTYEMRNTVRINNKKVDLGCVAPELVLDYYIAYLLMKYNITHLINELNQDINKQIKRKDFAHALRYHLLQFFDSKYHTLEEYPILLQNNGDNCPTEYEIARFILLIRGCGLDEKNYSYELQRQIRISAVMHDLNMLKSILDKPRKNPVDMGIKRIKSRLKNSKLEIDKDELRDIELTKSEELYAKIVVERNLSVIKKWLVNNRDNPNAILKSKITKRYCYKLISRACLYFFTGGCGTYTPKSVDSRIYGPLTNLSRNLRIGLPIKYSCFDIKQAYPTFLCLLLGIDVTKIDYRKIEYKFSLPEGKGKKKFNTTVNDHSLSYDTAYKDYIKFGFAHEHADKLAIMSTGGISKRGHMFRLLSREEERVIRVYTMKCIVYSQNNIQDYMFSRLHDSIIIADYQLKDIELPLTLGKITFEKTNFNYNDDVMYNIDYDLNNIF